MKKLLAAVVLTFAFAVPAGSFGAATVLASVPASHAAHVTASHDFSIAAKRPPPPPINACQTRSYSGGVWVVTAISNCYVVPPSGIVHTILCGELFVGTATPGTAITCASLPLLATIPCAVSTVPLPTTGGAALLDGADLSVAASARRAGGSAPTPVATSTPVSTTSCCPRRVESVSIKGTGLDLTVPGATIYQFNPATGTSTLVGAITGSGGEYTKVYGSCPSVTVPLPSTGGAASTTGNITPPGGGTPSMPLLPLGLGLALVLTVGAMTLRTRKPQV